MVSKRVNPNFGGPLAWRKAPLIMKMVWSIASFGMLLLGMGVTIACSPLEPLVEPEVSDLQLTVDTLKTSLRDAQRTIAELRTEMDSRRQELADAQIARAQLEGRVRETERRLAEARHVIDLQREELASSRAERVRVARTGAMLQNQLTQLQKQLARIGKQANDRRGTGVAPASVLPPIGRQSGVAGPILDQPAPSDESARVVAAPAFKLQEGPSASGMPASKQASISPMLVSVERGDTLWSIARRHRIPLKRLMAINQLHDSHIEVGQVLWLTMPAALGERELEITE